MKKSIMLLLVLLCISGAASAGGLTPLQAYEPIKPTTFLYAALSVHTDSISWPLPYSA